MNENSTSPPPPAETPTQEEHPPAAVGAGIRARPELRTLEERRRPRLELLGGEDTVNPVARRPAVLAETIDGGPQDALGGIHESPGLDDRSPEVSPEPFFKDLNIVFKVSERCNLKCDYCYFFFAGDDSWKFHPPVASRETLEGAARFARDASDRYGLARIVFIFHGGEPLLVRKDAFKAMCETLRAHETPRFKFELCLQTNGALIDDPWIDLFAAYGVSVGVSLDGPKKVNDLHRLDARGRSSYDATVAGLRRLQAAAREGRIGTPGLLCVIDPQADGAETYRHFVDDLGIGSMSFLTPDYSHDSVPNEDTVRGVNRFMLSVLKEWLADDNPRIYVRQFSEPMGAMLDDERARRFARACHDERNVVAVASNGALGPEDTLSALDGRFASLGLNVRSHRLSDLIATPVWAEQERSVTRRPPGCRDCGWWRICKGGRPSNRYSCANGLDNPSIYCEGLQENYSTMAAHLVRYGVPMDVLMKRLGAQC